VKIQFVFISIQKNWSLFEQASVAVRHNGNAFGLELDKISSVKELCGDSGTPLVSISTATLCWVGLVLDGKASVGE